LLRAAACTQERKEKEEKRRKWLSLNEVRPVINGDSVTFATDRNCHQTRSSIALRPRVPEDMPCTGVKKKREKEKKEKKKKGKEGKRGRELIPSARFEFSRARAARSYFTPFYFIPLLFRARARARARAWQLISG